MIDETFALEARLHAVTNLLLSHIVASSSLVEGLAEETTGHALVQVYAMMDKGRTDATIHLCRMVDQVRAVTAP